MARPLTFFALSLSLLASGCYDQGDGVDPPLAELYFPTGLTLSVGGTRLYAISSDFDLQYNGGAVHALDLERIRSLIPKECGSDADCDASRHCDLSQTPENRNKPSHWCVANDGPHAGSPCGPLGEKSIAARSLMPGRCAYLSLEHPQDGGSKLLVSSVGIGAFATDIIYRQRPEGPGGRLFIPVRGDATLHFIDVIDETEEPMAFELSCGQSGNDGKCDDQHRKGDDPDEENTRGIRLRPEPFGIAATGDAGAMVVTHQTEGTVSLFVNDATAWGNGVSSFGVGPKLEFELGGLPQRPIGIVEIPQPRYAVDYDDIEYFPGFLVTYRDAAQIDLLRFFDDIDSNPPRPFMQVAGSSSITANSLGFDSRGIALDAEARKECEASCDAAPEVKQCLYFCAGIQLPVYVANRSPSSLLVGKTRAKQNPVSSDDLPNITDSIPVTFGPSRVVVGKVVDQSGEFSTRVFVVSFDTRSLSVYDPKTRLFESFTTGRGPHGIAVDAGLDGAGNPYAYAYVAHFTDSYIGIIDLDQRHKYYGTIVVTLGEPHTPQGLEVTRLETTLLSLILLMAIGALGCSETPVSFPLRSLERSGEVSFVCVGSNGEGYDINACPDFESVENPRHLLSLVTQTKRGEVAIVDLSAGKVVDLDQSTPGYGFLPVGANPIDIVSTPGGVASFVGVAEVGKEAIFALPSSCARPPAHDLVSWPACKLPSTPGEMAILIDPLADDGAARATCDSAASIEAATPGTALAATREDCAADLALETTPPGRRKLLVMLPLLGGYAILDAQNILDREPGSFDNCDIERFVETKIDLPTTPIAQKVPEDLQVPCSIKPEINYGPITKTFVSEPAGIDVSDGRLFIADRGAPVVHVVDVHDPCSPIEQPPFLALSFDAPNRDNITTSHVAVSPPTTTGSRFVYAVDQDGDVMIFDATPGESDRTPVVRSGSPRLPFEAPDRIQYDSPARDVTFALRDVPIFDAETGVATVGTYCDPDPAVTTVASKYRPNSDFSGGARPHNLRGVFGFIMLASGQVAVVDVEDFDARCRRPVATNSGSEEDFRGCFGDPAGLTGYFTSDGKRTVSNELSCRVVEQHRSRSGRVLINSADFGVNAPALRNFPRLSLEGGNLSTDQSEDGKKQPRMLAVPSPNPVTPATPLAAEVYVGVNLYSSAPDAANPIDVDPTTAERPSLSLVLQEPRAFFGDDDVRLTFEGKVVGDRPAGAIDIQTTGPSKLTDLDGGFCDRGVEAVGLMRERGQKLGVASADLDSFARQHADYVQVISTLRDRDDGYWTNSLAPSCPAQGKSAFFSCRDFFGENSDEFQPPRDFVITDAYQGQLQIEPRNYKDEAQKQQILELFSCCFGGSYLAYNVRGGNHWVLSSSQGVQHNVLADEGFHCIRDCNPRRQYQDGRAFEISTTADSASVGKAVGDVACVIDGDDPVDPNSAEAACIFQNLTHRFAVYRGLAPSARDMVFDWNVTGGFVPLTASLASQSRAVSPQSIVFVPQIGQLAVADGAAEGLVLISLDSVNVSRLFF